MSTIKYICLFSLHTISKKFFNQNFLFSDQAFKFCAMKNGDDCVRFKDSYHSNGAVIMDNHPLMIMAREEQRNLLRHPLCLSLGIIFEIQKNTKDMNFIFLINSKKSIISLFRYKF